MQRHGSISRIGISRIGRMRLSLIFSLSARPANVARLGPSVTAAFNVKSQPLAFPDVVWIDARRLKRAYVEKHIRTAGVVCDEAVATLGIPHFQGACSHRYFPFAFSHAFRAIRLALYSGSVAYR
jgi:hypothetical protein